MASWAPSPHPKIHQCFWHNQPSEWGYEKKLSSPTTHIKEIRASDWTPKDILEFCKVLQEDSKNDYSDSSIGDPDFQNKRHMANPGESSKKGRSLTHYELVLDEDCLALVRTPWNELEEEQEQEQRTHDMVTRSVKAKLQAAVQSYGLINDLSGEILQVGNVFHSDSSKKALFDCIFEFFPSKDLEYIWRVNFHYFWLRKNTIFKNVLEAWLMAFVYGPLLSTLVGVEGTTLKMAEILGLYQRPVTPKGLSKKMRHDAVLRHEHFGMDIMVMEAKPTTAPGGAAKDMYKLRDALCGNLEIAEKSIKTDEQRKILRTYGLLFSKLSFTLIEARAVGPKKYMVYSIDEFVIPDNATDCPLLASGALKMIAFRRRIENTLSKMKTSMYKDTQSPY
ncbi:hypothetical protein BGZ65_005723 [Modicella reniformis]|uniref:Uncharacterized protein n=1 Tax=Modicella reniformis TaxID=1440133 RepID=A0A9P6IX24_9FUNG|nr:hypothetical protein BGZ65_005723 [Modicella reniformis]